MSPAGPELSLHSIQQSAPIPVNIPFSEDRSTESLSLECEKLAMRIEDTPEHPCSAFLCVQIHVEPGATCRMNIEIVGIGSIALVDFRRLFAGEPHYRVRFDRKRLNSRAGVIPGFLFFSFCVLSDIVNVKEVVVGVIISVVLVQRDQIPQLFGRRNQVFHILVSPHIRLCRIVHGKRVIIAAALPVVDQHNALVDSKRMQSLQLIRYISKLSAPDIQHYLIADCFYKRGSRVGDAGQNLRRMPGSRIDNSFFKQIAAAIRELGVAGSDAVEGGRAACRPIQKCVNEDVLMRQVFHLAGVIWRHHRVGSHSRQPSCIVEQLDNRRAAAHIKNQAFVDDASRYGHFYRLVVHRQVVSQGDRVGA